MELKLFRYRSVLPLIGFSFLLGFHPCRGYMDIIKKFATQWCRNLWLYIY